MANLGAPHVNNGATSLLTGLTNNKVVMGGGLTPLDRFKRAIKVFLMSYPESLVENVPELYLQKYGEYQRVMLELYELNQQDMSFVPQVLTDISKEFIQITFTPKRLRGGAGSLVNGKLRIHFQNQVIGCLLDDRKDYQVYQQLLINITFPQFHTYRLNPNMTLKMDIEDDSGGQFNTFDFIIANTTPEGFEDWVDFGRGVHILLNVEYKVSNEANIKEDAINLFHLQSIYAMLKKKLTEYGRRSEWTDIHQMVTFKYDVSYHRPYVTSPEDMFWSTPRTGLVLTPDQTRPQRRPKTVKFIDIQNTFESTEDFEDKVCLCTEWCNLNAFFYHNPIYRFLLVRHHQLYLKNMSYVPDMYLFSSTTMATLAAFPKKPVIRLIDCANEYRKKYYNRFQMRGKNRQKFVSMYDQSDPNPLIMMGLVYNKLRLQVNVTKICHKLAVNPFDEVCTEAIIAYYRVLIDLHQHMSQIPDFIADRSLWSKDFDIISRNQFINYLPQSFHRCVTTVPGSYDFIFTVDYEYANKFISSVDIQNLRQRRDEVLKKTERQSPYNVRIVTDRFLNTFVSISKFFANVESRLPSVYRHKSLMTILATYQTIDQGLEQHFVGLDKTTVFYRITAIKPTYQDLTQNFHVFYTLKLYFYGFEVQKNMIDAVLNMAKFMNIIQVCPLFNFIWNNMNTMIEKNYRTLYMGKSLFQINQKIAERFISFYHTFYGIPTHETNRQPNSFFYNVNSAQIQYLKLYFWLKNDGNNLKKFRRIVDELEKGLTHIIRSSETILNTYIVGPVYQLFLRSNESNDFFHFEVFDHLVYYLVKANCSMILSTTAAFIKSMHSLQNDDLIAQRVSFSMSKPGWVPLIRSMDKVLDSISRIRDLYIAYEDEFNRISNTCKVTKELVKGMYEQFYRKLSHEWLSEIEISWNQMPSGYAAAGDFMVMHLAYGLAFVCRFINDFRAVSILYRKTILIFVGLPPSPGKLHQMRLHQAKATVLQYLKNPDAIRTALPLHTNPWRIHLSSLVVAYNQLTEQQVNLDMSDANN